jgi:hypothetical protein
MAHADFGDLVVAFDDIVCQRLTHCTLCGRRGPGWLGIWCGRGTRRWLTLAVQLCPGCNTDTGQTAMDVKLRTRYRALLDLEA